MKMLTDKAVYRRAVSAAAHMLAWMAAAVIAAGCASGGAPRQTEKEAVLRVSAGLSGDDLVSLESQLRAARSQTEPNYPAEPILLVKSDWPLEWKGYGNPFQLRPYEEKVFAEVAHQPPPDCSTQELMLAFGWVHKNAEGYYRLPFQEQAEFEHEHRKLDERGFQSFRVHPAKEIAGNWLGYYIATGKKAECLAEVAHWRGCDKLILEGTPTERSDALDRITSPVTGELMEIHHPEFSPGNMHVDAFSLSELRESCGVDTGKFDDICAHQGIAEEDAVLAFYRVYGTKGTVKTGWVLRSRSNPHVGAESF